MKVRRRPALIATILFVAAVLTGCASEERLGTDRSWTRISPW